MVGQKIPMVHGTEPLLGYRLNRFIGKGSYGEVWRATSPDGKAVALKLLRCGSQQVASRELRALQSIRQLQHPNLLKTYQIWADSGQVIVAMELAEGNLLDLLTICFEQSGHALPREHTCFYLGQVAHVLDFLNSPHHQINGRRVAVRHCDVKPSNLLLFSSTVKLADFSFSVESTTPWGEYERVGTLNYAAPEIFQGRLSDRTDQFSLAVTYCLLRSGEYPFPEPPKTFERNYVRPAPNLSMLPAKEGPILFRALHPTPQNRWNSCSEFIDQLQQIVD